LLIFNIYEYFKTKRPFTEMSVRVHKRDKINRIIKSNIGYISKFLSKKNQYVKVVQCSNYFGSALLFDKYCRSDNASPLSELKNYSIQQGNL
jgi:hypothetical protein